MYIRMILKKYERNFQSYYYCEFLLLLKKMGLRPLLVLFALVAGWGATSSALPPKKPNIVFLVVESTDGRTWRKGYQNGVLDEALSSIRFLEARGASFHKHYSNSPVCCPSRATFWSGRHAHHIPHTHGSIDVRGHGIITETPANFTKRIDQVLADKAGYRQNFGKGGLGGW